ncbi:MAG: hypothetical protein WBW02_02235 [Candidatus Sulfotelmatobacter sp.]
MNQTSGHMQTEAQKPKNQKHNYNCPKAQQSLCITLVVHPSARLEALLAASRTLNRVAWLAV